MPHLQPGGVYLCEDVTGSFNPFASYMSGLIHQLNAYSSCITNLDDPERRLSCKSTEFQSVTRSIHLYPYVSVIEKRKSPLAEFVAAKHWNSVGAVSLLTRPPVSSWADATQV